MENRNVREYNKFFYFHSAAFALYFGSIFSLASLQSSIEVKENLGPTNLLLAFTSSAIGGLIVTPILIRLFGPKKVLIGGELLTAVYTAAFFKPSWYTVLPASVLYGLCESAAWGASSIIVAEAEKSMHGEGSGKTANSGKYYVVVSLGQILSDAITEGVLSGMNSEHPASSTFNKFSNASQLYGKEFNHSSSFFNKTEEFLKTCGSSDCPASYSFASHSPKFNRFIPDNKLSIYILLSAYMLMQIGAAIVHGLAIPSGINKDGRIAIKLLSEKHEYDDHDDRAAHLRPKEKLSSNLMWTFQGMYGHLTSLQGVLTLPTFMFHGIFISFIWSEFNRSFVSCTVGVEQVGLTTAIIDTSSMLTSLIISCFGQNISLPGTFLAAFLFEIGNFAASLFWVPSFVPNIIPYVLSITYGVSQSLRRNISFLVASTYFEDITSSFCVQNLMLSCGAAFTFGWSLPVCVYIKLYVMLVMSTVVAIMIFIAHKRYKVKCAEYENIDTT